MSTPPTHHPPNWREVRRQRAWKLHRQGWRQHPIADALGVTQGAVSQWLQQATQHGPPALRSHRRPGRPALLTTAQRRQLVGLLTEGAEAFGFRGAVWTRGRVARLIKEQFGIHYTPRHVGRILDQLGWSPQKPLQRASQRDEAAIAAWYTERWPAICKKARQRGQTIVWVDEAGFYLLAGMVHTYAPRGQTPILHVPLTRDHLAVISGITAQGRLLIQVQARAFKGVDVVRFLKHLRRHIAGPLLIIWDGAPIHHDQAIKAFLAAGGAAGMHLEQLPGYAPDLNPDEGVWHYLKGVELRNISCHDLEELRQVLDGAAARLRHKPAVIRSFIKQYGY